MSRCSFGESYIQLNIIVSRGIFINYKKSGLLKPTIEKILFDSNCLRMEVT